MTLHRLTINVPDETKEALDALKASKDVTYTEHVKRAVGLFNHVLALQEQGEEFRSYDKDGRYSKVIIRF